jgi:hypothetical protein
MWMNILIWTLMALFVFWFFGGFKYISKTRKRKMIQQRLDEGSDGTLSESLIIALDASNLSQFHDLLKSADQYQLIVFEPQCAKYINQLTEYVQKYPDQANGHYLLGIAETDIAWKIRSGAIAQNLTEGQVNDFMHYLGRADETFARAMALDPEQPLLYPMMMRVKKGLSKKQEAYQLYKQAVDKGVLTYKAAREMVSLLSERWLGEPGEMLDFAREQLAAHGQLPGMFAILLDAYIERDMETNEKKFFKKGEISKALNQADAEAVQSDHLNYLDQSMHYAALNTMALIHIERGEKKKAKGVFREILSHYDPHPWKYRHPEPKEIFMQYAMRFA